MFHMCADVCAHSCTRFCVRACAHAWRLEDLRDVGRALSKEKMNVLFGASKALQSTSTNQDGSGQVESGGNWGSNYIPIWEPSRPKLPMPRARGTLYWLRIQPDASSFRLYMGIPCSLAIGRQPTTRCDSTRSLPLPLSLHPPLLTFPVLLVVLPRSLVHTIAHRPLA